MASELPQWVQIFIALGGGAAFVKVWDRWISSSDKSRQDNEEQRKETLDFVLKELGEMKEKHAACEAKYETLLQRFEEAQKEHAENLRQMSSALASYQTKLEMISDKQTKIIETSMNPDLIVRGAVETAKSIIKEGNLP